MSKAEFINALGRELNGFPPLEAHKIIEYYEELFADGLEAGQTEEEICANLDTPAEIAERVRIELAFVRAEQTPTPKAMNTVLLILLGVFALPIGLPLAFAVAMVLFAVFMVVISLIGSAVVVALALGISGIAALCSGVYLICIGLPLPGVAMLGTSLILISLGVIGTVGFIYLIRIVFRGIVKLFRSMYTGIHNRKGRKTV